MGILLESQLYPTAGLEYTEVATAIEVAGESLVVDSTEGFSANDYIIIGNLNTEKTEIIKITSVTNSTTLVIAAVTYAHAVNSPVRYIPYNQVKFYRSTTETGTFTLIATEIMEVDNESGNTLYNDTSGTTSSWYKTTYYNEGTGVETAVTDSVAVKGGYNLYCTIEDVYRLLHFKLDDKKKPREDTVLMLIEARTKMFDKATNSTFISTAIGSTSDYQYVDGKGTDNPYLFFGKAPIISVTELSMTSTTPGSTASWTELTVGRDNDYILNKDEGSFEIVNSANVPGAYSQSIRWYGTWGYASTPDDVKVTVAKGVAMDLAAMSIYRAHFKGRDGFDPGLVEKWQKDWDKTVGDYMRDQMLLV